MTNEEMDTYTKNMLLLNIPIIEVIHMLAREQFDNKLDPAVDIVTAAELYLERGGSFR
jgi:hypothetical protein